MAPGTVRVLSRIVRPPARIASTAANASSADAARTTGTRPTSRMRAITFIDATPSRAYERLRGHAVARLRSGFLPCNRVTAQLSNSSRHPRRPALHHALDFGERGHAGVAGRRHRERAVRGATFDGVLRAFVCEESVDQAGGEGVAAADAVEDLEIGAWRRFVERSAMPSNRAPIIDGCGVCDAEGRRDGLQLRIELAHFADHGSEGFFRELAEVLVDAFDFKAEGDAEVFFVSEEHVDEGDELAIHGACFVGAADSFPE